MLDDAFLVRLGQAFPYFYARVDEEARAEAAKLRIETGGDVEKALSRARLSGTARLWWPYVKGSIPLVRRDRDAMEGFSRLVLTIDHVVGYEPGGMEQARDHVAGVLRSAIDYERLKDLVTREDGEAKAAAAGAGLVATAGAVMAPLALARSLFTNVRRWGKFVPPPARVAIGAVVVAALASVPLVAGYSAGRKAEQAARERTHLVEDASAKDDIRRAA
jgi:hypothetical protein